MVSIFIEGTEENFLKEIIYLIDNEKFVDDEIEFVNTGGYTNLENIENKLRDNFDSGINNLIIFDADYEHNDGGFKTRFSKIQNTINGMGVSADIFLFPNNNDDGDFELLLENCINNEHKGLLDCFDNYTNCVDNYSKTESKKYIIPDRKAKMYSYISAFPRSRKKLEKFKNKKEWEFGNPEYWNLQSESLKPLKEFLSNAIR